MAQLERDGFLLVPNALDRETVAEWKHTLYDLHRRGRYETTTNGCNYEAL